MQPTTSTTCSVDGCERRRAEMSLCAAHAQRVRRTGSAGGPAIRAVARKPKRKCAAEGCEKVHYCGGYCTVHYQRKRKHGTIESPAKPLADLNPNWRGNSVGYRAIHVRIEVQRGLRAFLRGLWGPCRAVVLQQQWRCGAQRGRSWALQHRARELRPALPPMPLQVRL